MINHWLCESRLLPPASAAFCLDWHDGQEMAASGWQEVRRIPISLRMACRSETCRSGGAANGPAVLKVERPKDLPGTRGNLKAWVSGLGGPVPLEPSCNQALRTWPQCDGHDLWCLRSHKKRMLHGGCRSNLGNPRSLLE